MAIQKRALRLAKRGAMGLSAITLATYGAIQLDTAVAPPVTPPVAAPQHVPGGGVSDRGRRITHLEYSVREVIRAELGLTLYSDSTMEGQLVTLSERSHTAIHYFIVFDRNEVIVPSHNTFDGDGTITVYSDTGASFTTPVVRETDSKLFLTGEAEYEFHVPDHHVVATANSFRIGSTSTLRLDRYAPAIAEHETVGMVYFEGEGTLTATYAPVDSHAHTSDTTLTLTAANSTGHLTAPDPDPVTPVSYVHRAETNTLGVNSLSTLDVTEFVPDYDEDEDELILALLARALADEEF